MSSSQFIKTFFGEERVVRDVCILSRKLIHLNGYRNNNLLFPGFKGLFVHALALGCSMNKKVHVWLQWMLSALRDGGGGGRGEGADIAQR